MNFEREKGKDEAMIFSNFFLGETAPHVLKLLFAEEPIVDCLKKVSSCLTGQLLLV